MGSCGHVETILPTCFLGLIFHSGGSCYLNQTKGVIILSKWVDPTTTDTINQQCGFPKLRFSVFAGNHFCTACSIKYRDEVSLVEQDTIENVS